MKITLLISGLILSLTLSASGGDRILGKWLTGDEDAHIEIYKTNNKYYGKIVWLKDPNDENGSPQKDLNNPDKGLRHKSIQNLVIVKSLTFDDNEWTDGSIYDPKSGKTYDCKMWLENDKTIKMRGYIGFVYSTQTWTKL